MPFKRIAKQIRLPLVILLFIVPGAIAGMAGIPMLSQETGAAAGGSQNASSGTDEKWGVKVEAIRTTAEGYMLDFRYRVTDPEKSMKLMDRHIVPYLIDQKTGNKISVQSGRLGPMRQTAAKPKENRVYTVIFSNPNKSVKKGDKVTVIMGDFRAENLAVQ
jgi:hypothetical protein